MRNQITEDTLLGIAIIRAVLNGDGDAMQVLMNADEAARSLVVFGLGMIDAYLALETGQEPTARDYLAALDRMTEGITNGSTS